MFSDADDETPVGLVIRRNRLKDSFGNLTLLTKPLNSSVSNGAYAGKRAALKDHSLLVLNREISAHDHWDEDKIVSRGKDLFKVAKTIWKYPQV